MNKLVVVTLAMVLVASMAFAGVITNNNLLVMAKKSDTKSSDSNGGSDSGSSNSGSNSGSSDNGNDGSTGQKTQEAKPQDVSPPSETNNNDNPNPMVNPSVSPDSPIIPAPSNDKPGACIDSSSSDSCHPATPTPTTQPDHSCAFHPDADKCKPDSSGHCPDGFGMNDKGNCFPSGPCPTGFSRHDNDESGKCFHNGNPGNFCHSHNPQCCEFHHIQCLFHIPHHIHTTVKVIHTTKVVHKKDLVGIPTVFVPKVGLVEPFNCKLNPDNGKIGCEFIVIKVIN